MKTYGRVDIQTHVLDLCTSWSEWSASHPCRFTSVEGASYTNRRLGGPKGRSGRHGEVKILAPTKLEIRALDCPARSQSLYRLHTIPVL
jgi:hypothetical protein